MDGSEAGLEPTNTWHDIALVHSIRHTTNKPAPAYQWSKPANQPFNNKGDPTGPKHSDTCLVQTTTTTVFKTITKAGDSNKPVTTLGRRQSTGQHVGAQAACHPTLAIRSPRQDRQLVANKGNVHFGTGTHQTWIALSDKAALYLLISMFYENKNCHNRRVKIPVPFIKTFIFLLSLSFTCFTVKFMCREMAC